MTRYACHFCRDAGRVVDPPRLYGDRADRWKCPYCAPARQTQAEANAEQRARIAQRHIYEDRIDELRRMYPDADEVTA